MGIQLLYARLPHLNSSAVDFSSAGDNTIVAAVAGKRILVHRLMLVASAATSLTFKRGSTNLSGVMAMAANGGITFDITGEPWFTTDIAEAFSINSLNAVQVGGTIYYDLK